MFDLLNNYLLRHVQVMLYSLGQLWRQPAASLMTVLVIGIALALPAGLYVLMKNIDQISHQWDEAIQISLFLKQDVNEGRAQQLAAQIESWSDISSVQYQSAQQSLNEFRQISELGDVLDSLPANPLPAILIVKPTDSEIKAEATQALLERLQSLQEVELAQLDMEWIQRLQTLNAAGQRGISTLAILLSLSVLLVIGNTIRLAILNRQTEIRVIKLVGGTNAFVRRPFLYTGFWYGLLGGIIAWVTLMVALKVISGPINTLASHYHSQFQLQWLAWDMFLTLPLSGIVLGIIGAWLAVTHHLDDIEPT